MLSTVPEQDREFCLQHIYGPQYIPLKPLTKVKEFSEVVSNVTEEGEIKPAVLVKNVIQRKTD
jgi:hypothetical protein